MINTILNVTGFVSVAIGLFMWLSETKQKRKLIKDIKNGKGCLAVIEDKEGDDGWIRYTLKKAGSNEEIIIYDETDRETGSRVFIKRNKDTTYEFIDNSKNPIALYIFLFVTGIILCSIRI